jgi:teichuronic acid biosynthesis glycosyltransferase TuaG
MDKSSLVSVIIPTYNHADFIREALESLCAQTYENWEAIVVNNFSEDNTVEVVASFGDSRIRLENFHNHGVIAASRNHAISLAKGDFLAFLDSDDTWFPEKLERCIAAFDEEVDLVCHGLRSFGDGPTYDFFGGPESKSTFDALLYEGNCLTPTSTVVRRECVVTVNGFTEDVDKITTEDYHLWIKLAANQSGSVIKNLDAIFAVTEDFYPTVGSRSLLDLARIRRRRCLAYYSSVRALQKMGQHGDAWNMLTNAWGSWPFYYKIYIALALNVYALLGR